MYKRLFVTGTDTEVGKKVVSKGLLQTLTAGGKHAVSYTPVAKSNQQTSYASLSRGLHALDEQADYIVIEGTGGWRSLMSDRQPLSGWVVQEQIPVVLVVGIKLGCISHALLTAQAILDDGLPLLGWVANRINPGLAHYPEIINVLQDKIPEPLLGELPYLPRAENRDLSRYFDLSPLNLSAR